MKNGINSGDWLIGLDRATRCGPRLAGRRNDRVGDDLSGPQARAVSLKLPSSVELFINVDFSEHKRAGSHTLLCCYRGKVNFF